MKLFIRFASLPVLLLPALVASAQLRLPSVLASGMVLQQKEEARFWGWGSPADKVYIQASWSNSPDSATVDNNAQWKLAVKTPAAGGPYTVRVYTSHEEILLSDVWVGEVWVCSGQSNMEWNYYSGEKDMREALPAVANARIRLFHIPRNTGATPQDDVPALWKACDSNSVKGFSAVGYFFGKRLFDSLQVPIGLINASWGGTPAEVWIPEQKVMGDEQLKTVITNDPQPWWPHLAGRAYNGIIHPIEQFNIAGVIWYQGESNTDNADRYTRLFSTLIGSWRAQWKKDLPFYYVQIAPFDYGRNFTGALLREAQSRAMEVPNTGMVVVSDLVDSVSNIHPSHKKPVGERLANWALAETYHRAGIAYRNPVISAVIPEKNKLTATVADSGGGLIVNGKTATGFFISENGTDWAPATATIKEDRIILSAKGLKAPVHLRYAFGNTIIGNVFGVSGLPLAPYRSDKQPLQ